MAKWRFGALLLFAAAASAGYPDADESRLRALLEKMTEEEKFLQTCIDSECPEHRARWLRCNPFGGGSEAGGGDAWFALKDNDRLGIRGMRLRDGPKGMTCSGGNKFGAPCPEDGRSPSFPSQILRAATWDVSIEEEIGNAVGDIALLLDVHAALLPTINILPWLNWGRAQETYGEDPFFSGKMGASVVRGVQRDGKVMATVKHFLANNIENTRWWVSAEFDDKTLHDVYLKAWTIVVAESSPELIMTSYNRVQGVWANTDPKFISILRDRLGFDGSVMTDWFASWEAITSGLILEHRGMSSPYFGLKGFIRSNSLYTSGVDMEMPFCNKNRDAVSEAQACAANPREVCETLNSLDEATARLLRSKSRYGMLEQSRNHTERVVWDNARFDELILRTAQRGIVLLKNEEGFLPKRPSAVSSVVVIGSAEELELGDHGSSSVAPSGRAVNVLQGLQNQYGNDKVVHIKKESPEADEIVRGADLVVLDVGYDYWFEGEFLPPDTGGDRQYLTLHPWDLETIQKVSALSNKVVVVMSAGASVIVEDFVDQVAGVLWMGYPGPLGGEALADILSGAVNPSGRMPVVTPKRAEDYLPHGINLEPWVWEKADAAPAYPYSHGFKHMWEAGIEPRFPFGYGMSYTSFEYSDPEVWKDDHAQSVGLQVEVRNTGKTAGAETVQVYSTCEGCNGRRLAILLVGFAKVHLEPGESRRVELEINFKELAAYDMEIEKFHLPASTYILWVGPFADARVLKKTSITFANPMVFDYPGKPWAEKRDKVVTNDCSSFTCKPAAESDRIKEWSLPSTFPLDPLLVFFYAMMNKKIAGTIVGIPACLLIACCCRLCHRCCCKAKAKVESQKKQN